MHNLQNLIRGRSHFKTLLISFKQRTLYKNIGNDQNLKLKY